MRTDKKSRIQINWKSNKGTAAVLTALMMSMILGFGALVTDIGRVSLEKSSLQNAVDAAALAAAQDLPNTTSATVTATDYMLKNGYASDNVSVSFAKQNRQITVSGSKKVSYTLARIIGINDADVRNDAIAEKGGRYAADAFNYAVFSGSDTDELIINSNGQSTYIEGSVHSNNKFLYNGNGTPLTITGALDSVGKITLNGANINIGIQKPYSTRIDMPDFSAEVKALAESVGQSYNTSQNFNNNIQINGAIYVNGHINFNCQKFTGTGAIMATSNIIFNNSIVYGAVNSSICIYSKNGDITINNAGSSVNGTFYAPNGTVILNNGAHTVYGRIIAKRLIFNGGVVVHSSSEDMRFLDTLDDGIKLVK